jgi:hypothetical protein
LMRVFWTLMLFLLKWRSFLYQQWVATYCCIDGTLLNSTLLTVCCLSFRNANYQIEFRNSMLSF